MPHDGDVADFHAGIEALQIAANYFMQGNQQLLTGLEICLQGYPLF